MTELPPMGIGTYGIDPADCAVAVETALDYGYRHIDTAEMYGTESAVKEGISRSCVDREEIFIATKIHSKHLAYDDVIAHTDACRDRLGVDVIDLLYVHWPIRTYDAVETLAAFDELYDRGDIRHVGLSNFTPALLRDAIEQLDAPVTAHQVECHPFLQQAELRRIAREHGHALVAYSPLAKGALLDDPVLMEVAEAYDATPAQVALAWLHAKPDVIPIPCSTDPVHIRDNLDALDLTLDDEAMARIDAIDRTCRQVDFPDAPWNSDSV